MDINELKQNKMFVNAAKKSGVDIETKDVLSANDKKKMRQTFRITQADVINDSMGVNFQTMRKQSVVNNIKIKSKLSMFTYFKLLFSPNGNKNLSDKLSYSHEKLAANFLGVCLYGYKYYMLVSTLLVMTTLFIYNVSTPKEKRVKTSKYFGITLMSLIIAFPFLAIVYHYFIHKSYQF